MTGAEYIAEFLSRVGSTRVFLLTGGACAIMVDAVARHPALSYVCFEHEQAAAMAADAVWRVDGTVGVTMATSGPGATNLITGIACSYFDSIPSLHITGQVNQRESNAYHGADVRQTGFQETRIAEMVRPITKYAVKVTSTEELRLELAKAYAIATSGRMGPVLIDVPMDVQQSEVVGEVLMPDRRRCRRRYGRAGRGRADGHSGRRQAPDRALGRRCRARRHPGRGIRLAGIGRLAIRVELGGAQLLRPRSP